MHIEEHVALAPYTSFGIGGPARYFICAKTPEELAEALSFARSAHTAVLILGGGSNMLVDDRGFDGVVIQLAISGVTYDIAGAHTEVVVGAGESWDGFVSEMVDKELWGVENLSGIPGTVGGAVVGNIGAYGQVQSQTLQWVEVYDRHTGEIGRMSASRCAFGYRESLFKQQEDRYVVLHAAYQLSHTAQPDTTYADLQKHFADKSTPSISSIREAVLSIRKEKFPNVLKEGSAGSFFKNPIVTTQEAALLHKTYPDMPQFTMPETNGVKIPLGWLIDHVLHLKGFAVGNARLFEKQALVIAAKPGCTAHEVRALAEVVREKIFDVCGITIEHEVKIIS